MQPSYHQAVHRFALFLVACTLLLLIAGALVTSNEAALSVPDWPLSYGTLLPPMVGGIVFEDSHRKIAGAVLLLTLILAIWLWRAEQRRWMRWLGLAAFATVLLNLHYGMPVAHACLAQIFFGILVSIALFTSNWWNADHARLDDSGSPSVHSLAFLNAGVIFLQVVLGAGFRHKDIPIWPHLVGAGAVLATVTWTGAALRRRFEHSREMRLARILLHSFFGMQFLLGIGALWSRMSTANAPQPLPVTIAFTVAHTVVGALLFACSIAVVLVCRRLAPRIREVVARSPEQAALS